MATISILSIFFLREKVGNYRWLEVIEGIVGIIIISEQGKSSYIVFFFLRWTQNH